MTEKALIESSHPEFHSISLETEVDILHGCKGR